MLHITSSKTRPRFIKHFYNLILAVIAIAPIDLIAQEPVTKTIMAGTGGSGVVFTQSDYTGNVISFGSFNDTLFPIHGRRDTFKVAAVYPTQWYISKHNREGQLLWINYIERGYFLPRGLMVDSKGNSFVALNTRDTLDVDPSSNTMLFSPSPRTASSTNYLDFVVIKFDTSGRYNMHWRIDLATVNDVTIDNNDNFYICGHFWLTTDMDPSSGYTKATPVDSSGGSDAFVSKLDTSFRLTWFRHFEGTYGMSSNVIVMPDSGVIISGRVHRYIDLDPGVGKVSLPSGPFTVKLSSAGNYVWAKSIGGVLAPDKFGNFYALRDYYYRMDLDPSGKTFWVTVNKLNQGTSVSKFDKDANFLWGITLGDSNSNSYGNDLACDDTCVFVTGSVVKASRYKAIPTGYTKPKFEFAAFYTAIGASGPVKWVTFLGGTKDVRPIGSTITFDSGGYFYVGGYFGDTCAYWGDRYPDTLTGYKPAPPATLFKANGYILRFGQCPPDSIKTPKDITFCDSFYHPQQHVYIDTSGLTYFREKTPGVCSKLIAHNVKIAKTVFDSIDVVVCKELIVSNGTVLTKSQVYTDTLVSDLGCDSLLTINLTIKKVKRKRIDIKECESYTSPSGKYVWTRTGFYTDTLTASDQCDSLLTIGLTIHTPAYTQDSVTSCDSFLAPSGMFTWFKDGMYQDTLQTTQGCDSVTTYALDIKKSSFDSLSVSSCAGYWSPSRRHYWQSSGAYLDTIANQVGCDSVIRINLGILENSDSTIQQHSCDSFTSPSGRYTWKQTGLYKDTIPNANSCDSFITIDLTVGKPSFDTVSLSSCKPTLSPSKRFTMRSSGLYKDTLLNDSRCDSMITIMYTQDSLEITNQPKDSLAKVGQNAEFRMDVISNNKLNYQWFGAPKGDTLKKLTNTGQFSGTTDSNLTVSNLTLGNDSTRVICVVTAGTCSDTSQVAWLRVTKNNSIPIQNMPTFRVYPNPNSGSFEMNVSTDIIGSKYSIFDSFGRLVGEGVVQKTNTIVEIQSPIGGVYIIHVDQPARYSKKLLVIPN